MPAMVVLRLSYGDGLSSSLSKPVNTPLRLTQMLGPASERVPTEMVPG